MTGSRKGLCYLTEIKTLAIQPHPTQFISCNCIFLLLATISHKFFNIMTGCDSLQYVCNHNSIVEHLPSWSS